MASNSPGPQGDRPFRGSAPVEPLALATLSELVGEPMLSDPPPPPKKPGRPSKASTAVVVGLCSVAMVAGVVNLAVSGTSQDAQADQQQAGNQQTQNGQAGDQAISPTKTTTPSATATTEPAASPSTPTSGAETTTASPTTPATKPTAPGDATKPADGPGGVNPAKPVTKPVQKPRQGGNKPGNTSKPRPVTKPKPVVKPQPTATKPVARPNPITKPTDIARPEPTQDRPRPKPDNDRVLPDGADAVIRSFNDKRARQGIAPLKHDACLTTMVATPWAKYIASIQQPKLQNPPQSVNVCPGYFRGWEQVGVGRLDGDDFANLITSKSHNLGHVLSPQYTHIGIGRHYDGQGRSYWVLEMAGPNGV